ncbi:MAG: paraquat-inducible protein A [Gammaproteobacteria bacterium]|nr:paraquat-inducible protein A [Gammaproteobacteria bacterium]
MGSALTVCHACDALQQRPPIEGYGKALCYRCGALLYRGFPQAYRVTLALQLTALLLFILMATFPFITLELKGSREETYLLSAAAIFFNYGMGGVGLVVAATTLVIPLLVTITTLLLLVVSAQARALRLLALLVRFQRFLAPWSMVAVFALGVMVTLIKLQQSATLIPGVAFWALLALLPVLALAQLSLAAIALWPAVAAPSGVSAAAVTAHQAGLCHCALCDNLAVAATAASHCPRCGSRWRSEHSRQSTVLALLITGTLLLIPANIYPIMSVYNFGRGQPDTILSGIIKLIEAHMWGLAVVIFIASILVPWLKLLTLYGLLYSTLHRGGWRPRERALLHRITEAVGVWSMTDIFIVALMAALVNLGTVATIAPGPGAIYFCAAVMVTMLAAAAFDTRTFWRDVEKSKTC